MYECHVYHQLLSLGSGLKDWMKDLPMASKMLLKSLHEGKMPLVFAPQQQFILLLDLEVYLHGVCPLIQFAH